MIMYEDKAIYQRKVQKFKENSFYEIKQSYNEIKKIYDKNNEKEQPDQNTKYRLIKFHNNIDHIMNHYYEQKQKAYQNKNQRQNKKTKDKEENKK